MTERLGDAEEMVVDARTDLFEFKHDLNMGRRQGTWRSVSSWVNSGFYWGGVLAKTLVYDYGAELILAALGVENVYLKAALGYSVGAFFSLMRVSWDSETVERTIYRAKKLFSRDADYWGIRKPASVVGFLQAVALALIETWVLKNMSIGPPVLKWGLISLNWGRDFAYWFGGINNSSQRCIDEATALRPISKLHTRRAKVARIIRLLTVFDECIKDLDNPSLGELRKILAQET